MDKGKESQTWFCTICKGDPLACMADDIEVSSEKLRRLTQDSGDLAAVINSSSYMFN